MLRTPQPYDWRPYVLIDGSVEWTFFWKRLRFIQCGLISNVGGRPEKIPFLSSMIWSPSLVRVSGTSSIPPTMCNLNPYS